MMILRFQLVGQRVPCWLYGVSRSSSHQSSARCLSFPALKQAHLSWVRDRLLTLMLPIY